MTLKYIKIKCPCCERNLQRRNSYYRKREPYWVKRYYCTNCKKSFNQLNIFNTKKPRKRAYPHTWKGKIKSEVKRLINQKMIAPFVHDIRKDKTYPSSRMITFIIYNKYNKRIDRMKVCELIKRYRN